MLKDFVWSFAVVVVVVVVFIVDTNAASTTVESTDVLCGPQNMEDFKSCIKVAFLQACRF